MTFPDLLAMSKKQTEDTRVHPNALASIWNVDDGVLRAQFEYKQRHYIDSANTFLKTWRFYQDILAMQLHTKLADKLKELKITRGKVSGYSSICDDLERQHNLLIDKSLCSLHDFVLACYYAMGEKYRDDKGNCKLILLALPGSESYYTLAEDLIEVDKWQREKKKIATGREVTAALDLRDPIGTMLNDAQSFRDAANIAAHYCYIQASIYRKDLRCYKSIKSNMHWIIILTCQDKNWVEKYGELELRNAAENSSDNKNDESTWYPWILRSLTQARTDGARSLAREHS